MKYKYFIILSFSFLILFNLSSITVNADTFGGGLICSYDYYDINDYFDARNNNSLKEEKIGISKDTIACYIHAGFSSEGQSHFFKELSISFNNNDSNVSLQYFEPSKEWDSVTNQNGTYLLKDTNDSMRNSTRHQTNYIGKVYFKLNSPTPKGELILLAQLKDMEFENYSIHPFIELTGRYKYDNAYNVKLKSLEVNGKSIPLKENEFYYFIEVPYETEKANIRYASQTLLPSVIVTGDENLKVGDNIYKIKVSTTVEGNSNEYTVNVIRLDEKYSDASLKSLSVEGYNIKFDKNVYEYKIKIKNEKKLNIKATANSDMSKVSIMGNSDLEDESNITIKVESHNGTIKRYKIKISKDEQKDNKTAIIIISTAINIGLIIYIIIDKIKRKKTPQQEETMKVETKEEKTSKEKKKH